MNLQLVAEKYRKEILWDGDWKILGYRKYNFEHKKVNFIQKVFSIRNEGKHKVVRFLGIKFKIRRCK